MGQHVFSIIELSKKGTERNIISLLNMTNTFVANYNLHAVVSSKSANKIHTEIYNTIIILQF